MRTLGRIFVAAALAAVLAPALAAAEAPAGALGALSRAGPYLLAGGGVMDFTDRDARDRLGTGGTWDLRLGLGLHSFVGAEVAYVGSSWSAGSLGDDLRTGGLEGVLRLQYPWERDRWLVAPFAFAGLGWTHFDRSGARGLGIDDTVVPVGAGVTLGWRGLLLDARYTFRRAFDDEVLRATDGSRASLNSWALSGAVGYAF